ncbi:TetR/AcrR family transcriptional regulator [Obesumbacterium proteus]|uniref:TetR/AcrR family transcriptional regulator n=1 Tax=Obesumbacterium proteus TaxID=82983 RepID=UPI0010350EE0|nr:TetR/AcrR family transcriptional regulator [Obesumbacterium proteus]TBL52656.1 TetR/AcrR family transcriptional regulator [Obesumbacterium proteus]TBL72301.1 TetR/AcrR family transcriptional regulator [Obesumbacterium proteus]
MGRQRSIDREKVLDAAEEIIANHGAAALTIDSVARAMGISKGGVQYCFGNKDALIDAMFERWGNAYDRVFDLVATQDDSPVNRVAAHVVATHKYDQASSAKAAGLLVNLLQTKEHLENTRSWYRERIENLDLDSEQGKQARIAFLAAEGAFMLRYFGLMDIDQTEWESIFHDIETIILPADKNTDKDINK